MQFVARQSELDAGFVLGLFLRTRGAREEKLCAKLAPLARVRLRLRKSFVLRAN